STGAHAELVGWETGAGRQHDHPATGEELVSVVREEAAAESQGSTDYECARAASHETTHPGNLPERRGMGKRRLWRGGSGASPLRQIGLRPDHGRGGAPGRDPAGSQAT